LIKGTSIFSTCYLTVVVTPSLSAERVPVRFMVKSKPDEFICITNNKTINFLKNQTTKVLFFVILKPKDI